MSLSLCNSSAFNPQTVDNDDLDLIRLKLLVLLISAGQCRTTRCTYYRNIWIWDQSISVRAKLACICHLFKTLSALWNDDKGGLEGLNCWNTISSLSKLLSAELMEDNSTNPTLNLYFGRRQNWVFGAKKKKVGLKNWEKSLFLVFNNIDSDPKCVI